MKTDLFSILKATPTVTGLLGNPPRVYPFGRAPQNAILPYAVYTVEGLPENYLGQVPDIDRADVEVTVYADKPSVAEECFEAIRDAVEPHAHMTSNGDIDRESATDRYAIRMTFTFWQGR